MRTVTSFALVALMAACAVGPGYRRPGLGMPAGWRRTPALQDSLRPFYDSLRASRDVRTAVAAIDEFRAQYRATRGALLPELTGNGEAGRNELVFGTFGAQTFDVYRATADLSWELDLLGRVRRNRSSSQLRS